MPTETERAEMLQALFGKKLGYESGAEAEAVMRLCIAAKQAEALRQCGIALGWMMETLPAAIKQRG